MKKIFLLIVIISLFLGSCKTRKEARRQQEKLERFSNSSTSSEKSNENTYDDNIKVVFEDVKVLDIGQYLDPQHDYFVIIGSFRNIDNLENYKEELKIDGFDTFRILRNDKGLHRISILETNEEDIARSEIKRIRKSYPKYVDVWLLKDKK